MNIKLIIPIAVAVVAVSFIGAALHVVDDSSQFVEDQRPSTAVEFDNNNNNLSTNSEVPYSKIVNSVPRDAIPPLNNPKYISASGAVFLEDDDIVIGFRHDGEARAYPLSIMLWHEIVNDEIGGLAVAITYCPLCFTSMVFERTLNGEEIEFGNTGKLYNNNMVMYDKKTESFWSQGLGTAITGELAGQELKKMPFDIARWSEWESLYPDTLVLSTDTGYSRAYGADPYREYFDSPAIYFPLEHKDERLHPKDIVMGLEVNDEHKGYRLHDVVNAKVINDSVGDEEIVLLSMQPFMARAYERTLDGSVLKFSFVDGRVTDEQTGSVWNFEGEAISGALQGKELERMVLEPSFWFSWSSFHRNTQLYVNN